MSQATISIADILAIEDAGYSLYRAHESERALALHTLALRLRTEIGLVPREFRCNVDESAGMAEVVELWGHSRKAPCS